MNETHVVVYLLTQLVVTTVIFEWLLRVMQRGVRASDFVTLQDALQRVVLRTSRVLVLVLVFLILRTLFWS